MPVFGKGQQLSVDISGFASVEFGQRISPIDYKKILLAEPDCSPPQNVRVVEKGDNNIYVVWEGKPASANDLQYIVRYRSSSVDGNWNEIGVKKGNSIKIEGLQPASAQLEVEVCKVCFWLDGSEIKSEWVKGTIPLADSPTLPPFTCGAAYSYSTVPCTSLLQSSANVTTIYSGGFPIEITTLIPVDGGFWAGTGTAPLPFGEGTLVSVEWSSIRINSSHQVCQGVISGTSDSPGNYPDLDPGPISFGGEICVPPPSTPGFDANGIHNVTGLPWDENGFGPNRTYVKQPPYPGYQAGFPYDSTGQYDPNGFDVDGFHAITGTMFNPQGCGANGIDSLGNSCNPNINPYSWMDPTNNNSSTQAGLEFVHNIQDSIVGLLQGILNSLSNQAQDSIDAQKGICNGIRTQMTGLVSTLNINPSFLFGANNEYFAPGMHLNFNKKPEPLAAHFPSSQRKPEMKQLEGKHIDLYVCDQKEYVFVHIKAIVAEFLGSGLQDLKQLILNRISQQPQAQIDRFVNEPGYFLTWLKDQVKIAVQLEYLSQYGNGVGALELEKDQYIAVADRNPVYSKSGLATTQQPGNLLAANDFSGEIGRLLIAQSMNVRSKDIAFEYLQGFRMVHGVHRAYYMDAISKARQQLLTPANPTLMPIEVANIGTDGRTYRVFLDNINFLVGQPATLDAYVVLELPSTGQRLVFEAQDVNFTPFGLEFDSLKIQLATDVNVRLNNVARLKLIAGPQTFVTMNCDGYAGLGVAADVEICRSVVKPYNPATEQVLPEPARVNGHFVTYAPNFSEIMVSFSIDPFVVTGAEDVKWLISGITLDMSETVSPSGAPPQGYNTPFANANGFKPLWKGFYARDIQVTFPKKFANDTSQVNIGLHDLLIDDMGFSCSVSAQNILSLNKGNAGGWAISIENVELVVLMNNISKAEFSGKVHVPIFRNQSNNSGTLDPADCFSYYAIIQPDNGLQFAITQPSNQAYAVDIWKAATVTIASSSIRLTYDGSFHAVAQLNGTAAITGNLSANIPMNIPVISFQDVEVSNEAPYFSPGHWGFPTSIGAKLAGFELSFNNIRMVETSNGDPALDFNAFVGISDDTTKIKATGGFRVTGELVTNGGRQRWIYKSFNVKSIDIQGGFTGVPYIRGFAHFFEGDTVYGTGFRGGLDARFECVDAEVQVVGQFGRVNGFKYFFLDALVCTVVPMGPVDLRGLGGGVYYHMNRPDNSSQALPACAGSGIPAQLGASLSGIVYTPSDTAGLGLKITVAISLASSERAFNANATFEMLFNTSGGLDRIWIYGNAKFMDDLNLAGLPTYLPNEVPSNNAAISANLSITLNFQTRVFDGTFDVYADVAGVLIGAGDNKKVCAALLHFAPNNDWYIKIGSPNGPKAGMVLTVPGFGELGRSEAYLQIGQNVEPIPNLPADIAAFTGLQVPRKSAVSTGKGFCFGVDLNFGKKDFRYMIFSGGFTIHMGFDVSVLDYGAGAVCDGQSSAIGVNGWYAEGQVYAAIEGQMGIKVKIFGKRKEYSLLYLKVATALEAKLPNPFWARGAAAFQYNILNGLVKGVGNFQFELGEQCAIQGVDDPFKEVPIILSTSPTNNATGVPVLVNPNVKFNFPVGAPFQFESLNGGNIVYNISLDSVKLLWRNQLQIPLQQQWSTDRRSLVLNTGYFLPGKDTFTLIIKVHVDSSGITIDNEERIVNFITGPGMSQIPASNVAGSYPLDGQYNFYKAELTSGRGYIQMRRGQPELFFKSDEYDTYVRFRGPGAGCIAIPLEVDASDFWEKKIEFDLPLAFLANESIYEMQVLDFPRPDANYGNGVAGNAPCTCTGCTLPPTQPIGTNMLATTYNYGSDDNNPPSGGSSSGAPPSEKVIYSAYFRVSQYNTFMEKVAALETTMNKPVKIPNGTPDDVPLSDVNPDFSTATEIEPFDGYEIQGGSFGDPLVTMAYGVEGNSVAGTWILGMAKRVFYPYYGVLPLLGYGQSMPFPNNTVAVTPFPPSGLVVTKDHFTSGLPSSYANVEQKIRHFTPKVIFDKFQEASGKSGDYLAANHAALKAQFEVKYGDCNNLKDCLEWAIFDKYYPVQGYNDFFYDMLMGLDNSFQSGPYTYPVRFTYRLPGLDQKTFSGIVKLKPKP